jgi:hypothetical protein
MIPLLVLSSLVGWTMALAYYIRMKEAERQNKAIVMELYQTLQEWSDQIRICRTYANHIRSLESQIRLEVDSADYWKNEN